MNMVIFIEYYDKIVKITVHCLQAFLLVRLKFMNIKESMHMVAG